MYIPGIMLVIPEQGAISWGGEKAEAGGPGPGEHTTQEEKKEAGNSEQKEAGSNEKKEVGQGENDVEKTAGGRTGNQDENMPDPLEPPNGIEGRKTPVEQNRRSRNELQRLRVSSPTFNRSASAWPRPETALRRKSSGALRSTAGASAVEAEKSWLPGLLG